ncbi:MAG: hypothetical protein V7L13_25195, partial [Nostoc sp.]|uniref:hypothetical protein n=1 Tax=Nostoc sp. TaxID=1180 RepID=UPI002FF6F047
VLLRIADLSFFTPKRSRSSIFLASAALSPLQLRHLENTPDKAIASSIQDDSSQFHEGRL